MFVSERMGRVPAQGRCGACLQLDSRVGAAVPESCRLVVEYSMTLSSACSVVGRGELGRPHRSFPINSDFFSSAAPPPLLFHPHHLARFEPASHNGFLIAIEHSRAPRRALHPSAVLRLHWLPQLLDRQDPGLHSPRIPSERSLIHPPQSLKETFAAKLPGEIEKIKKLRKYASPAPGPLSQR